TAPLFRLTQALLCLRLGQVLLGLLPALARRHQLRLGKKARDAVARDGTLAQPVLRPLILDDQTLRVVSGQHGVIGPHPLDKAAVARATRVGDDDGVVWALLGATAGKTNTQGHLESVLCF